jgi:hypothetical protein
MSNPTLATTGRVYVNECDPNAKQWELYNAENYTINLAGWTMYKDNERETSSTFVFAVGDTIAAGGYLVLTRNTTGSPTFGMSPTSGFKYELLNAEDDEVDVFDNLGENIINNSVSTGQTLGRLTDGAGEIVTFIIGTIGATNNDNPVYVPPMVDPEVDYSLLVINEVDGNNKFVELYNKGGVAIPLAGLKLYKNGDASAWWTGAADSEIAANGYHTIYQSGEGAEGEGIEQTGGSGISPKKTVSFDLKKEDEPIDRFARLKVGSEELDKTCTPDYGTVGGYSFSRCPDGVGAFELALPTPQASNGASEGDIETTY